MTEMTRPQCHNAIVEHLQGKGWVPIADLAPWLAERLGMTPGQGRLDLSQLVRAGRLSKRDSETVKNSRGSPSKEYRAVSGLPAKHGTTCRKVPHTGTGHLHGKDYDGAFDIDGLSYCGRCHAWMGTPALS